MDVSHITEQIITALAPYLPILLSAGQGATEKIVEGFEKKVGEDLWGGVKGLPKALWEKLNPAIQSEPQLIEAAKEAGEKQDALALSPGNSELQKSAELYQTVLKDRLREFLKANSELAHELESLLKSHGKQTVEAGDESEISDVEQTAKQSGVSEQTIRATNKSKISSVKQTIQ